MNGIPPKKRADKTNLFLMNGRVPHPWADGMVRDWDGGGGVRRGGVGEGGRVRWHLKDRLGLRQSTQHSQS